LFDLTGKIRLDDACRLRSPLQRGAIIEVLWVAWRR
jgi:hypothetical protein